jgi:hypothetical protein
MTFSPAAERVTAKRIKQIEVHGYTPEHDATHPPGQFALAAKCLSEWALLILEGTDPHHYFGQEVHDDWPWDRQTWNRCTETVDETLVNAAALLAAECDRYLLSA